MVQFSHILEAQTVTKKKVPAAKGKTTATVQKESGEKKLHERTAKTSELERREKGLNLAASYLEQRDGMDAQLALDIASGMDPADLEALIAESNTAVIAQTKVGIEAAAAETVAVGAANSGPKVNVPWAPPDDEATPATDWTTIPALAEHETFAVVANDVVEASKLKNLAEKDYKAGKKTLDKIMAEAGCAKNQTIECLGNKLTRTSGSSSYLSKEKLMEKGVSIDVINQCWDKTEYDDVRIWYPKPKKEKVG